MCMVASNRNLTNKGLSRLGGGGYSFIYLVTRSLKDCTPGLVWQLHNIIREKRPSLILFFCSIILSIWLPFSNLAHGHNMAAEAPDITLTFETRKRRKGRRADRHMPNSVCSLEKAFLGALLRIPAEVILERTESHDYF